MKCPGCHEPMQHGHDHHDVAYWHCLTKEPECSMVTIVCLNDQYLLEMLKQPVAVGE